MNCQPKYYYWILPVLFLFLASHIEAQENKAYLKDGQIVVETKEGLRATAYSSQKDYLQASSKKWNINEKVSPVDEAMTVYKNRSEPLYNHKIHYYGTSDGDVNYFIEYTSGYKDSRYLLSPQGGHIYYLGLNSEGKKNVYGHDLTKNTKYLIGGGNNFQVVTCNENTSFVIVQKDQSETYDVFDAQGNKVSTIAQSGVFEEIQDKIKEAICI